jgi:hypothetical protein
MNEGSDKLTVLPYQNTHLVAQIVEDIRFEKPSSPNSNHILISFYLVISPESEARNGLVNERSTLRGQEGELGKRGEGLTSNSIHFLSFASVPLAWTVSIGIQLLPPIKILLLLILK